MSKPTHKMFKSRVKKEKPARKRAIEDGDVDDGDAELSLEELRELKEDQKFRERKRLQSDGRKTTTAATEATTSATSDSSLSTLDGQFMTQSADLPVDPFEAIKNKYIEAKLKEKYAPTTTTDSPIISKERSEELELYSIPEHLRHQPTDHSVRARPIDTRLTLQYHRLSVVTFCPRALASLKLNWVQLILQKHWKRQRRL
ncbi:hypothetical protein, variant 2 [Aphanomyces astaci]|uniref:Uncharacterized protein n=1 Tax=Aphanomyces astaci TaxID=112090 RepID=W4H7W8_APHAT|nr:hypothetical protein, variant 3 [Aphanomyces astaci]XP_009822257.1 hypothetical protein, variant 2 [Aphanomyces astaci]ETV87393.1 hypothetical protein, variant 2 [Aphanomyces astaci]ETV87394.1 hypothetical protein, variant 3 [Aphanomyces astaci]|eukprot:XP_009822256.1 hypothetical protein, variant 3 [Aphanomyces astaci]